MTSLDIVTCSYALWTPDLGVPVGSSVGKHPAFRDCPQADAVKPWGVFRKMDDEPLDVRQAAYAASLDRREDRVWNELRGLADDYAGNKLVLLCWCNLDKVGADACHRRWFSTWAGDRGVDVPEVRSTRA